MENNISSTWITDYYSFSWALLCFYDMNWQNYSHWIKKETTFVNNLVISNLEKYIEDDAVATQVSKFVISSFLWFSFRFPCVPNMFPSRLLKNKEANPQYVRSEILMSNDLLWYKCTHAKLAKHLQRQSIIENHCRVFLKPLVGSRDHFYLKHAPYFDETLHACGIAALNFTPFSPSQNGFQVFL